MAPAGSLKSNQKKIEEGYCEHVWHLSEVIRFDNRPHQGYSEWVCDCGAVKQVKLFAFEVIHDE